MKTSKFKSAFIILSIATIVWVATFYVTYQEYNKYREWFYEQSGSEWGLASPYYAWNGGVYVVRIGALLICAWIMFGVFFFSEKVYPRLKEKVLSIKNMKKKKGLLLFLAVMLYMSLNSPLVSSLVDDKPAIIVNVLLVGDEEFMAMAYPFGLFRWVSASQCVDEGAMPNVDERFYNKFGITFYWDFGWQEWDSNDETYNPKTLLDEAIGDVGFESGMLFEGRHVDVLMVWTEQDMGQPGYSPPWLNACIFSTYLMHWSSFINMIQHELSHQFYGEHCRKDCILNLAKWGKSNDWCSNCFQTVSANKFRYTVVGDVNGDYCVDIFDAACVNMAWSSVRGDENWIPSCDINGDGAVNLFDLAIMSAHWYEHRY